MKVYQRKLVALLLAITGASLSAEESGEQWDKVYAKVKAHLMLEFTAIDDTERSSAAWIKQNLGASDEQIRKAMMDIHTEAVLAHNNALEQGSRSLSRMRLEGAVRELGGCADSQTKDFLLDYAASKENDPHIRSLAVSSYLRAANAEEARDVLLRFLVGDERMGDYARSSLYVFAKDVWDASSPDKKAAILQALFEAASSESPPWLFEECDSRLLLMDPAWRDSPRRKSMLERQLSLQFSEHYTDLKNKMEKEFRRISLTTRNSTVSTNAAVPSEQAESQPSPDSRAEDEPDLAPTVAVIPPVASSSHPPLSAVPLAVGTGLLIAALIILRRIKSGR